MEVNLKSWCKVFFHTLWKSDVVENNMSESFNGFIIEARYKSIIFSLEHIRKLLMKRIAEKRKFLEIRFKMEFGLRIWIKIEKNISECYKFTVT